MWRIGRRIVARISNKTLHYDARCTLHATRCTLHAESLKPAVACSLKHETGAFTLIELLITTAIAGLVAMAIVSAFTGGLKLYTRAQVYGGVRTDVLLALEKMERDIRNVLGFSGIDFVGKKKEISFAGLIKTIDKEGNENLSLGRILYYFDTKNGNLVREEQGYSQAILEIKKKKGDIQVLASINDIKFSYYCMESVSKKFVWKDSWGVKEDPDEGIFPLGVKIEATFKDGVKDVRLVRTVFIPLAG